jgi:ribonuclease J
MVSRTINKLIQRGANVLYHPVEMVHVSGHASREELKLMLNLVRPRYFIPIHGELRQLTQHCKLAEAIGVPRDNIAVVENGTMIEFEDGRMTVGERVPGRYVFVDGMGVGDVGRSVMRDRETLARDGFVFAVLVMDGETGKLLDEPELISRGFVYVPEAEELFEDARERIREIVTQFPLNGNGAKKLEDRIESALKGMFQQETKRRPMIFVHVNLV